MRNKKEEIMDDISEFIVGIIALVAGGFILTTTIVVLISYGRWLHALLS